MPPWPCPACARGNLRIDPNSFNVSRLPSSTAQIKEEGFHPDHNFGRFSSMLVCDQCREPVALTGEYQGHEYQQHGNTTERLRLRPLCMQPGSPLMEVPANVPESAADAMQQSFISFWGDRGSAANRLRISVERIMDAEQIEKGKRLVDRIEDFGKKHPKMARTLDALRFVGNVGSHEGDVGREELLDAFETYQDWLRDFYGKYPDRISKLREKLIAKKGKY